MQRKQQLLTQRKCEVTNIRDKLVKGETGLGLTAIHSYLHHTLPQLNNYISKPNPTTRSNKLVCDQQIVELILEALYGILHTNNHSCTDNPSTHRICASAVSWHNFGIWSRTGPPPLLKAAQLSEVCLLRRWIKNTVLVKGTTWLFSNQTELRKKEMLSELTRETLLASQTRLENQSAKRQFNAEISSMQDHLHQAIHL